MNNKKLLLINIQLFNSQYFRYEYANLYHTMTDFYNVFVMMEFFNNNNNNSLLVITN